MVKESRKVLVVDDEKDLREAIATALTYEGFEVVTADNGEKAVLLAETEEPDLILLDVLMPKKDGIEALREIRSTVWGSEVPIIIMTVLDDMNKVAEVVEAGGDEYLIKTDVALGTIVQKVKTKLGV